ncbi:transporter [Jeongeupia sp. HS-3]|nr:transporter [Jeongeupia sp. HS-3]
MRQHLMLGLLTISLFASPLAEAKRLGGGRSSGLQRQSAPQRPAPAPQQQAVPAQTPAQQPARSGVGTALAGAAAGAVGGYMLGKAMNGNNASGASESQGDGIPWGWILLLGGLTIGGVMYMRRRAQRTSPVGYGHVPAAAGGANWQSQPKSQTDRVFRMGDGMNGATAPAQAITRLPDGTESAAFLRQARASFLHMQALNSPEQLEELRNYLTPQMFTSLQAEIGGNQDLAEFSELQVELLDAGEDNGQLVASARFYGKVSESLGAPAVPFAEVWHFVKLKPNDPRWVLAGIQQAN